MLLPKGQDQAYLLTEQYKTASNLRARIELHERFSTNKTDFAGWIFDHIQTPATSRVLELGTGSGNFWLKNKMHIPETWTVTLSDLSPGMLEAAKAATKGLKAKSDHQLIDAQAIPFPDHSFDLIMANHMLYHVPDIEKALSEIRRVLKPKGRFYAATNGDQHMQELDAFIVDTFVNQLPNVDFQTMKGLSFRLENGLDLLKPHFNTVKLHLFDCNLAVTEAEPMLNYILSMHRVDTLLEKTAEAKLEALIQEAKKKLESHLETSEIFYIRKATGLFEARSPVIVVS